ncbi:methionine synthase [Ktedonosporobacter rubrisoli]|uniref:Methionine synthase n=1 Tax=Ktedonosporobacter rubrisoli TaxID=2509675 RepID=A0A4P6JR87_KTERU|nr:cobalamin-independent methionine synthase II family protein [Ktedonosporobacter rubrisoli]QBD77306.1 methionine synthase [Ktedonosporobacter rubrisoli]
MTIHSEVIGSLLRPAYLLEARRQVETGQISAATFKALEDRAVDEAIGLQEVAGIEVITDGEMRRASFFGHLVDALEGFDPSGGRRLPMKDEEGGQFFAPTPVVVEKLKWRRSMCAEEWVYLRARRKGPLKVTLVSAQPYYDPQKSREAYPSYDAYLADVVEIARREVQELRRLGCSYIQLDAPQYASLLDPDIRAALRQRGIDPDKSLDLQIACDNAIIDAQPGVTFGLHICRGNNQSKFYASGDYEPIARVFRQTRFQRFLLEYDDPRSGGFEPLQHVPQDRFVVLGLVSTKRPQLETAAQLRERIEQAARFFPLEQLALSPQCGFASTMEGNSLSPQDQQRKLKLVAQVARQVWG